MSFGNLPRLKLLVAAYPYWVSHFVTSRCYWVLLIWLIVAITVRSIAPSWSTIAADGDLAFLPPEVPSAIGRRAVEAAFPGSQSRSQMLIVLSRENEKLTGADLALGLEAARRLHWMAAENAWRQLDPTVIEQLRQSSAKHDTDGPALDRQQVLSSILVESLQDNLKQVVEIENDLAVFVESADPDQRLPRQPTAHQQLGELYQWLGDNENASIELDTAKIIRDEQLPTLEMPLSDWSQQVMDVYTWRNRVLGHKLSDSKNHARLIAVQLGTEFMATANIEVISELESMLRVLKEEYGEKLSDDLQIEVTGSAAVGADVLRASANGVKKTEIVTVVLVLGILIAVYRSPLLVAIPIISIIISLLVSTGVIALLAKNPGEPTSWGLGVFTTTRIFIVVLLFGAGTDFCLFLLARSQELLAGSTTKNPKKFHRVLAQSWRSVHMALIVSAATTIVGLSLMWFSRFEKFQFSGPVIAVCLAVTLCVCLTLTPALLSAIGAVAFWPSQPGSSTNSQSLSRRIWDWVSMTVVSKPGWALALSVAILLLPAVYGFIYKNYVTYDLTAELSLNSPSRRGERLVHEYFATNHGSPVTVIVNRQHSFANEDQLRHDCESFAQRLYIDGVEAVRSLTDPLGDYPPGKSLGVTEKDAWRKLVLTNHRLTRQQYVSSVSELASRVAKFDIVLSESPFSLQAAEVIGRLQNRLESLVSDASSNWYQAEFAISGTAIGIDDLRSVTQSDQTRIQILVTVGVWLVLVLLLRHWSLAIYLMLTVLLSYFATLGTTQWFFEWLYAGDYQGLDWKVPLFLFVILVAVGQDYNVYLVSRIQEEQKTHSEREGVQRALYLTGGIITSCGVIMAGTFVAMVSPAVSLWLAEHFPQWFTDDIPVLRGTTELGFALSFGILLDTILVRSILVPAFVVLWQAGRRNKNLSAT